MYEILVMKVGMGLSSTIYIIPGVRSIVAGCLNLPAPPSPPSHTPFSPARGQKLYTYDGMCYLSSCCAKCSVVWSSNGSSVAQFTTDDSSVSHTPVVMANGTPHSIVEDLHTSLNWPGIAVHESNKWVGHCMCVRIFTREVITKR